MARYKTRYLMEGEGDIKDRQQDNVKDKRREDITKKKKTQKSNIERSRTNKNRPPNGGWGRGRVGSVGEGGGGERGEDMHTNKIKENKTTQTQKQIAGASHLL